MREPVYFKHLLIGYLGEKNVVSQVLSKYLDRLIKHANLMHELK